MKYARVGSGRPLRKRIGELAQRDRQKQVKILINTLDCCQVSFCLKMLLNFYDETTLKDMQMKAEQLRDISQMDMSHHLNLWRESMQIRRQYIRENSTSDILQKFPGYSNPILVSLLLVDYLLIY